jgi:hypothetical protein
MSKLRIGSGAGFSTDRIEPAVELAERGGIDFLAFECLAERTIALAQAARQRDPDAGFDPLLEKRLRAVLPVARANGVRIVTNMGAANPVGAAHATARLARSLGLKGLKIAAVTGDDVMHSVQAGRCRPCEGGATFNPDSGRLLSANAYLGAASIVEALDRGADIVITGRVGDPALFLGPLIHSFGWRMDDWPRLGRGTAVGHLLECAGQLTGGYFADPGHCDVPALARLGFPLAEVDETGDAVLTKVAGSGGLVTVATCKQQLLYEVFDPAAYVQPDVISDFSGARFEQIAPDAVAMTGVTGRPRPRDLKVSLGYEDGYIGEGQISYAGPGAVARAQLALEVIRERVQLTGLPIDELDLSIVGLDAVNRTRRQPEPAEVRARVAARTRDKSAADQIGLEVEALYTNGPAGGGGVQRSVRKVVAVASAMIDRDLVRPSVELEEV